MHDVSTPEEIRDWFNEMIEEVKDDPERVAKLEIAREYYTNPAFRKYLEDVTFEINQGKN